jgi:hypothetical protein
VRPQPAAVAAAHQSESIAARYAERSVSKESARERIAFNTGFAGAYDMVRGRDFADAMQVFSPDCRTAVW